jgi:hypothetical protein
MSSMPKPKPKRVNRNKKPQIKAGDTYTVTNAVELADVDNDGAMDLSLTHMTKRNGEAFFEAQQVWYGIDPMIAESFQATYADAIGEDKPIKNFGQLVKHWKMLSKGTEKITDAGAMMAEGLGEAD